MTPNRANFRPTGEGLYRARSDSSRTFQFNFAAVRLHRAAQVWSVSLSGLMWLCRGYLLCKIGDHSQRAYRKDGSPEQNVPDIMSCHALTNVIC
jgi:hypothetical protein